MTYIPLLRTLLYFRGGLGLHWLLHLSSNTNVCGFIGANGSPSIFLASPTSVGLLNAFTSSFKLVLIYLTPRGVNAESTLSGFKPTPVGLNRLTNASS